MHRCGTAMGASSYAGMPCSCPGGAHPGGNGGGTSAFTILFDSKPPADHHSADYNYYQYASSVDAATDPSYTYYSSSGSSCSSPVDCTLSLGTASTRHNGRRAASPPRASNTSCLPGFYWDIFGSSSKHSAPAPQAASGRGTAVAGNVGGGGCSNSLNSNADPLLARRCANCDTTSTPLWRNGPRGPKSLCNACGIRYKKEERRAAATAASDHHAATKATTAPAHHHQQQHMGGYGAGGNNPWVYTNNNTSAVAKHSKTPSSISLSSSSGDYLFHGGQDGSSSNSNSDNSDGIPNYLSWFNVQAQLPRATEYLHHY